MIGLEHFLVLSAVIFVIGLYGALTKTNVISILMCIELMFNGVLIAMVALSRWVVPARLAADPLATADGAVRLVLTGQVFAIFIIAVAAAEVALGLGIIMAVYRARGTVNITRINLMKR